jgi:NAD(P)-dependent dehydrogenase (short-subunit alcohol dehydrogenase family)
MGKLDGKLGFVTGAARGLGRACAQILAREGAKVVVADIQPEGGDETVRLIKDAGGEALFARTDISRSADVQAMVCAALDTYGGLDCAINNAVLPLGRIALADISEEDWDRSTAVNFTGFFLCLKYEVRAMLEHGGGAIVSVGSGHEHAAALGVSW